MVQRYHRDDTGRAGESDNVDIVSASGAIATFVVGSATAAAGPASLRFLLTGCRSGVRKKELIMVKVAFLARLVAKPGKEEEVAAFLSGALPLAQAEPTTVVWFAFRLSKSEFGIFDAFPDEAGRKTHLNGPIAAALMAKAGELFAEPPKIDPADLLAAKLAK
jgi:quinol monooxygenase YgiN